MTELGEAKKYPIKEDVYNLCSEKGWSEEPARLYYEILKKEWEISLIGRQLSELLDAQIEEERIEWMELRKSKPE